MTQDRLDASLDIDLASPLEIVRIIQEEDAKIAPAIAAERERIAHAIDQITDRMLHGGRMFYVGAGTSGRIAMLDDTGPEVVMGSTRMKSGTAQKMILNTISTGVMIRIGRVHSNLMIDMPATNEKLRSRAVRMVEIAAGVTRPMAVQALRDANGSVRVATLMAKKRITADEARGMLAGKSLRELLG